MNFNLFDGMDGMVLREREGAMLSASSRSMMPEPETFSDKSWFPPKTPVGMAYVPFQQMGKTYSDEEAFRKGTIFPELDFPFMRGGKSDE